VELKEAFRLVYFKNGNIREIARREIAAATFKSAEALRFLEFMTAGKRGIARSRRPGASDGEDAE
jgi:acyl-[acyl carrier protein]--UDP-N-acetylglucosamine O-acyltransferase